MGGFACLPYINSLTEPLLTQCSGNFEGPAEEGGSDIWLKVNIVKTTSNFASRFVFM